MSVLTELDRSGLRPVLEAALKRYRRDGTLGRSRPELPAEAWQSLARLTGEPVGRTLDLAVLDQALLRSRYGVGLAAVLRELNGGPIVIQREAQQSAALDWNSVLTIVPHAEWRALLRAGQGGAPALKAEFRRTGDVTALVELVGRALAAAHEAPSFPVLAAQAQGDAHALDTDRLAGRVFRSALDDLNWPHPERDAVSRTVLCAGLTGTPWLAAALGHCLALPLREVLRLPDIQVPGRAVHVVENPSVFEALHDTLPELPLICTQGQPNMAVTALLQRLPPDTTAHLSCDLDLGGLRIATFLMQSVNLDWRPWRMDPENHTLACQRGSLPLASGTPIPSHALEALKEQMTRTGRGAHQENLLPELIDDARKHLQAS